MVEIISLKDLNLSDISWTKEAYIWDIIGTYGSSDYATRSKVSLTLPFLVLCCVNSYYPPTQSRIRPDLMFSPYPPKMLCVRLKEMQYDKSAVNVVLVGAAPCSKNPESRRCALISTYSKIEKWGELFYLPYSR